MRRSSSLTVVCFVVAIVTCVCQALPAEFSGDYVFKTLYFEQPVDHFSFANTNTFKQKYLIADQFWQPGVGPIFFYAGNEGQIEWFCNNTGFMWDIAPEFKALLIFAEHRYYGASMPFGDLSYKNKTYLGYLSSEQALADFSQLLTILKKTIPGAAIVPIIAFGGSYGGMLASWMRIKYPHVIQGSLASSAPIWQFTNLTSCNTFNQIVTNDFTLVSHQCSKSIRRSWDVINKFGTTDEGRSFLSKAFRLCSSLKTWDDVVTLKNWLNEVYGSLAMVDYPYPASFMEPLPAWPIKEVCKPLVNSSMESHALMKAVCKGIAVYFNYTGNTPCFNTSVTSTSALGNDGWNFQSCTEMVMPMCTDGVTDMFEPAPWDFKAFSDGCYKQFQVRPRDDMTQVIYGGKNITAASNIIFSNGALDPWSGGGVLKSLSESLVAIYINQSAHHLDLRSSHPDDPQSVIQARNLEKSYIRKWIRQYYNDLHHVNSS